MKTACYILVALAMLIQACSVCTAEQTRCVGNIAEICDSRGHWREMMNCDEVEGESAFTCQTTVDEGEEAHTCLPEPQASTMEDSTDGL